VLASYVVADLVRNPRRTLSTVAGVILGVGLFCGVLFFVDGLSASMTQRAVAPLAIDMQRIVTDRAGDHLVLTQAFDTTQVESGDQVQVTLVLRHDGETDANEVTVRSLAADELAYVAGSASIDDTPIPDASGNPFANGPARAGYNLGRIRPGTTHTITYRLEAAGPIAIDDTTVATTYSSRESVNPIAANQPATVDLQELADEIERRPGVAAATPLSLADLGSDVLHAAGRTANGPTKIIGLDAGDSQLDPSIDIVDGGAARGAAVLSVEAARALDVTVGEAITIELPDGSVTATRVSGIADLSQARSLFSSRRGGDLETFVYVPNAVIVPPDTFADDVFPAYERAASSSGAGRLKSPPIREVDITLDRDVLDADPATAATETEQIAADVMSIASHQDYLLDNITNTLHVATADAAVAKRLFVFLGVPGALLAAVLAGYAGNVLAEAQRREHAVLRIRGASRRHLLRMLALRTALLTAIGATAGLALGYGAAAAILGQSSLARASTASLTTSAVVGTVSGYFATGAALYLTGRRSIDREINADRALLDDRAPVWRRAHLDLIAATVLLVGTIWALASHAFDGTPGSVYYGRSVQLDLTLLVLPIAAWITGSLLIVGLLGHALRRIRPASQPDLASAPTALLRRSITRRPSAIGNGTIVVSLIVALATSLAAFTASYDRASANDARYANGSDIRITPSPTATSTLDIASLDSEHIAASTPVIYAPSNVILRSARTSDPANLAAIEPIAFANIAAADNDTARRLRTLDDGHDTILLSADMAAFLHVAPGDTIHVLLARATPDQTEIELTVRGLFERLPGFPDGADAVMNIADHEASVPGKNPDFYLAATDDDTTATLDQAVTDLRTGPAAGQLHIDTRTTTLDRDQSSLAALNIAGLVDLDSRFALAMVAIAITIFVFGLLLQRRREYVTLRALGLEPRAVRTLIAAEAGTVAAAGALAGIIIGAVMGSYFVAVLRPLFVLDPDYRLPFATIITLLALVALTTIVTTLLASRLVNTLQPTELLRDD
jgi:putative ABC transport system permease protein